MSRKAVLTGVITIGALFVLTLALLVGSSSPHSAAAQIDPTSQQQTLDAMVAQMFAQAQTATAQAAGGAVIATATPPPAEVGAIVVNSLADDPRGCPRNCTLRSAIATAQPGDTITFDPALTGVIALSQPITIDKDLAIAGITDDQIVIDGANTQFNLIIVARDVRLQLSRLTFQNAEAMPQTGSYQSALVNAGTLSLADVRFEQAVLRTSGRIEAQNVTFTLNRFAPMLVLDEGASAVIRESTFSNANISSALSAGWDVSACVISNSGTLELTHVQIENNQCGGESSYVIANPNWAASLTINESTLQNNSSARGINAAGTVTISETTLSANGNIGISGAGHIQIRDSVITSHSNSAIVLQQITGNWIISNSTIANNRGQAISGEAHVMVTNSTITRNGGGIDVQSDNSSLNGLTLSSSIVVDNGTGPDVGGTVISLGNNLIGNPGDTTGWFASDILNADPLLAPLGDYGGTTQTMALYEGSPAIGAGYCLGDGDIPAMTTDQRGVVRKDPCDIGAYETEPGNTLIAPTTTPTFTPSATRTPHPTDTPTQVTPTSTPTITPTSVQISGLITSLRSVNVRSGPGVTYLAIDSIAPGTPITIIATDAYREWYQIQWGEEIGWVNANFVEFSGDISTLPVSDGSNSGRSNAVSTPELLPTTVSGISGRWEGTVSGSAYGSFSPNIVLTDCTPNRVCGSVSYARLSCGGEITLLELNNASLYLYQDITYGTCLDDYIRLERQSDDRWQATYYIDEREIARGLLTASDVVGFNGVEPTAIPVNGELRQWAAHAEASSQYGSTSWSAAQVVGSPDTNQCGDIGTAWASRSSTGQDSLTVYFDQAVVPTQVNIHQTYHPGAITSVELLPADGGAAIIVPNSADPGTTCPGTFSLSIDSSNLPPINGVRLNLDQTITGSWNEIDAVELVGVLPSENAAAAVPTQTPIAILANGEIAFDAAITLDGSNDYVEAPSQDILDVSAFTVELWVYPTAMQDGYQPLVVRDLEEEFQRSFGLYIEPNSLYTHFSFSSDCTWYYYYTSNTPLPIETWTHVAITYDGTNFTLYYNGEVDRQVQVSGQVCQPDAPLSIGHTYGDFPKANFGGRLAEVRIWDHARTQSEIAATMNAALTGTETGLVALYPLTNTDDGIAEELVVGNNGIIHR